MDGPPAPPTAAPSAPPVAASTAENAAENAGGAQHPEAAIARGAKVEAAEADVAASLADAPDHCAGLPDPAVYTV